LAKGLASGSPEHVFHTLDIPCDERRFKTARTRWTNDVVVANLGAAYVISSFVARMFGKKFLYFAEPRGPTTRSTNLSSPLPHLDIDRHKAGETAGALNCLRRGHGSDLLSLMSL